MKMKVGCWVRAQAEFLSGCIGALRDSWERKLAGYSTRKKAKQASGSRTHWGAGGLP